MTAVDPFELTVGGLRLRPWRVEDADEVLAALRDDPATRAIPVVVISADATEGQRRRLLAAGAHDYLTKPLQLQRLLDLLDAMLTPAGAP